MEFILELLAEIFFDGAIEFIKNPKFNLVWRIFVLVLVSVLYIGLIVLLAVVAINASSATSNTSTAGKVILWLIFCFVLGLFITFFVKLISALKRKPSAYISDADEEQD